jgi:hypothetical protein
MREELGDTTVTGAPGETFTAANIDAVRSYSLAQDLAMKGACEESIPHSGPP